MGEQVVMRKAVRLHCQPGPNLASETLSGSPAAIAAPTANVEAMIIATNRTVFQVGFMADPFQLGDRDISEVRGSDDLTVAICRWVDCRAQ